MPQLSNKARKLPASAIRKLSPSSDEAEAAGVKVYHLNIGAPDIKSPAGTREAVRDFEFDHLPYSNSAGTYSLRRALIEHYYHSVDIDLCLDDIIVTVAGSESVSQALLACCDEGEEVMLIEPFYTNYATMAEMNGIGIAPVYTDIRDGFALPSIKTMEEALTPKTRAILLCNPNNPSGTLYPKEVMLRIGEFCLKHDLFLISDEVYREFCYTDEPHFSALSIPGMEQSAILVDSLSKRYNLCGARVGAIISRNHELMAAITKIAQARLCPPVLGMVAAEGAVLNADATYFKEVRDCYIERRNFTIQRLNAMEGVFSPMPMGAFYTLAELPVNDAEDFAKWLLTDFRMDGETVMITPAESFYATPGAGRNQVRIAYVLDIPELQKALDILEAGLKEYSKLGR